MKLMTRVLLRNRTFTGAGCRAPPSMTNSDVTPSERAVSALVGYTCGAVVVLPFDRVKSLLQVSAGARKTGAFAVAQKLFAQNANCLSRSRLLLLSNLHPHKIQRRPIQVNYRERLLWRECHLPCVDQCQLPDAKHAPAP